MRIVPSTWAPSRDVRRQRRGPVAWLCVAVLHLIFLGVLTKPATQRDAPHQPMSVSLRLLPSVARKPERAAPGAADPATAQSMQRITSPIARPITPPNVPPNAPPNTQTARPRPLDLLAAPDPTGATTSAEAAPLPEPPASQPPRPLDLNLPRGYGLRPDTRNPVIDDPQAHTARLTPEQRMARVFDLREVAERLGDGRVILRRGADCAVVTPARVSQLFPTDPSAARAPGTVGACP